MVFPGNRSKENGNMSKIVNGGSVVLWLTCSALVLVVVAGSPESDLPDSVLNFGLKDTGPLGVDDVILTNGTDATLTLDENSSSFTASLECSFNCGPQFDFSWHTVDGRRIDQKSHTPSESVNTTYDTKSGIVTSVLNIRDFDYSIARDYTCLVVTPSGFANATVLALFKPELSVTNVTVAEGESFSVQCSSIPGAVLDWRLTGYSGKRIVSIVADIDPATDSSLLVMNMTAGARDTSAHHRCCVVGRDSKRQTMCSSLTVEVSAPPILMPIVACTPRGKCALICNDFGFPQVQKESLTWWGVNESDPTLKTSLNSSYFKPTTYFSVAIAKSVNYNDFGYCECTAINSVGNSSYDTSKLIVGGESIAPPFLNNPSVHIVPATNTTNFSVNYYCEFQANPPLTFIGWIKQPWNGNTTGSILLNQQSTDYTIKTWNLTKSATATLLTIYTLDDIDISAYVCIAQNDCGDHFSNYLTPDTNIANFSVVITNEHPKAGDTVNMTCSAVGFPLPNIDWKVLAEYDLNYGVEVTLDRTTGQINSTLTMVADWHNDHLYFECSVYNDFQPETILMGSKTVVVNHAPQISDNTTCSKSDFGPGKLCVLSVSVQVGGNYSDANNGWLYYFDDDSSLNRYANITDGTDVVQESPHRWLYSLTLGNYSAGQYEFWATFNSGDDRTNVTQTFIIDPSQTGVLLNGACTENDQCLTLYSQCQDLTCQCVFPTNILSDNDDNSTECLSAVQPGDNCLLTRQCSVTPNYYCSVDKVCVCSGYNTTINGEYYCIQAAKYGKQCDYDEECWMTDINTDCVDNVCACANNFNFNSNDQKCVAQGSLSVAAICIICVAALLLTALIGALIAGCVKRRRNRQTGPNRNDSCINPAHQFMDDDEPDVPYSRFSNSAEETQDSPKVQLY